MSIPAPTTVLRLFSSWSAGRMFFALPPAAHPRVALTFDDGPHPEMTPKILDVLAAADVQATFFVQGSAVRAARTILHRAHREGHCIASHGMSHISARKQPVATALANATQCHQLLEQELGVAMPRLYRPPYGELTIGTLRALWDCEFRIAFWNRDSNDSFVKSATAITQQLAQSPPRDGDILLFHDDYSITAEALPEILRGIAAARLNTVRLD